MLIEKKIVRCHNVVRSINPAGIFTNQSTKPEFFALRKMLYEGCTKVLMLSSLKVLKGDKSRLDWLRGKSEI